MDDLGDRLVILVIAVTGFAVLIGGWAGGLVEAEAPIGWEIGLLGGLALLLVLVLAAFWTEFALIDRNRDPDRGQE